MASPYDALLDVPAPVKAGGEYDALLGDEGAIKSSIPKQVSTSEALFPRATNAKTTTGKIGGGALDALTDVLKIPPAAAAALYAKLGWTSQEPAFNRVPEGTTFASSLQNLNEGNNEWGNPSTLAKMASSPATLPSLVTGFGAGGVVEGVAPRLAKSTLGRISLAGSGSLAQGAVSGTMNEADSLSQGKGFNPKKVTKEALETGATGTAFGGLGEGLKSFGSVIVKAAIKAGYKGEKEGFDVANIFKNELGGTFRQMTKKTENALKALRGQQDAAIQASAATPIPVANISKDLVADLNTQLSKGKLFGDEAKIRSTLQSYAGELNKLADANGNIPLDAAYEIKKKLAGDAVSLYQASKMGNPVDNMAQQKVAAMFSKKLMDAIEKAAPDVAAPNKKFAEIIPIAKALAHRNVIAGQHNPVGLDELLAMDAGVQFATTEKELNGLILPFLVRASKMPSAGNALYKTGDVARNPGGKTLAGMLIGANQ